MSAFKSGYQIIFSWVPGKGNKLPYNAFQAAKDIYIARVRTADNDFSIGKIFDGNETAFVTFNDREEIFAKFEVLCYTGLKRLGLGYVWINCESGELPSVNNLVIAGRIGGIRPIYIARCFLDTEVTIGKVINGEKFGRFPFYGNEVIRQEYDILCFKDIG